jgi:hypothetical protein
LTEAFEAVFGWIGGDSACGNAVHHGWLSDRIQRAKDDACRAGNICDDS